MNFIDRPAELGALEALMQAPEGQLAVVWGRRRIGKSRLLVEWVRRHAGLYLMADELSPKLLRRFFLSNVGAALGGFSWGAL